MCPVGTISRIGEGSASVTAPETFRRCMTTTLRVFTLCLAVTREYIVRAAIHFLAVKKSPVHQSGFVRESKDRGNHIYE